MVNYYRRFLPSIACTLQPLTDTLRDSKKGPDKLDWSVAMDAAFAGAKQALLFATHLAHPTVGAELSVVVCGHSLQAAQSRGSGEASLGGRLCKSALRVSGCRRAGMQAESSPPSLPGVEAGVADVQLAAGISFSRMAANQASCPSTLQALIPPP